MSPNLRADYPATYRRSTPAATHVLAACALLISLSPVVFAQNREQKLQNPTVFTTVPQQLLLQIVRAEDERRWDNDLRGLLSARSAVVRKRAALAAGRIGDDKAVADLVALFQHDDDPEVRAMAAFALGEIESPLAADALVDALKNHPSMAGHPQALEALGKIVAALPKEQAARAQELARVVLETLAFENRRRSASDELTVQLGLTAVLRAKPDNAGPIVAEFLSFQDPRIRADAANTLARLKLNNGNEQLRKLLKTDPDPIVRANAARVLGATEDTAALDDLLERATKDEDERVWVSALRALATFGTKPEARAVAAKLTKQGGCQRRLVQEKKGFLSHRRDGPDCLDQITTLGRMFQGSDSEEIFGIVRQWSFDFDYGTSPETEIALVRISPARYLKELTSPGLLLQTNWRAGAGQAQALAEIATLPDSVKDKEAFARKAQDVLLTMLDYRSWGANLDVADHTEYAMPDVLRAYAAFKPKDLGPVLRKHLLESDVVVRGTAADLLGELPPDETNLRALVAALTVAFRDKESNDAVLSILDALAKQKSPPANVAIKTALDSPDHLIRRRAVALLQANGAGDFSSRIGTVTTRNTTKDYERALARIGKRIQAVVKTSRGSFTIELLPDDAPLTVDNFVQLAKRGYFKGITVHRVVPNFVIQDGDPRGDGNGGPGYQIRCEINEVPYDRGAVGMALSGKDTGGSQWFVTHSPQPHLDGGYTVFGKVVSGMEVVDAIVRGDVIQSITITESARRTAK